MPSIEPKGVFMVKIFMMFTPKKGRKGKVAVLGKVCLTSFTFYCILYADGNKQVWKFCIRLNFQLYPKLR